MTFTRPVCVAWGSESYFALKAKGFTESRIENVCVMSPPGYEPPKPRSRPRCFGERAPADRRGGR